MSVSSRLAAVGVMGAVLLGSAMPAWAKCTRLGFTVNDYGKDGPTKDAKDLLDKYIAEWAKKQNISSYTTGKKTVSCELFLDVGFFDEHTCRAEASVCWGGDVAKDPPKETASTDKPKKKPEAKKKPKKEE
jgi:hypothetical protein